MKEPKPDNIIKILLVLILIQGFDRLLIGSMLINVVAYTNLLLVIYLFAKSLFKQKKMFPIVIIICIIYFALLGFANGSTLVKISKHLQTYTPFLVAFLVFKTKEHFNFKKMMVLFSLALAIGAIHAIMVRFFFTNVFYQVAKSENADNLIAWGRLPWLGSPLVILFLSQFFYLKIYSKKEKMMIIPSLVIILIGGFFTFNRTLIFSILILSLFWFFYNWNKIRLVTILFITSIIYGGGWFFSYWSNVNENFSNLIEGRILRFFSGDFSFSVDEVSIRGMLYEQYFNTIKENYFMGTGLGVPYSTYPDERIWSDVSIISFFLPFGPLGLYLFIWFVCKIYKKIKEISTFQIKIALKFVLLLSLIISLNDDIWSHKIFPVYLAIIINSILHSEKQENLI